MRHLPLQLHRVGEVLEVFEKKGKPYHKIIEICSRCEGTGHHQYNEMDGTTCYGCQGSGVQAVERRILTDKEKQQRERAKQRREEKKAIEMKAKAEERVIKENQRIKNNLGFDKSDTIYIVDIKNTYDIKDELKKTGANYNTFFNWYFKEYTDKYPLIEIKYDEVISLDENGYCKADNKKIKDIITQKTTAKENESVYQGSIGDKIEIELTYINYFSYETQYGNQYIHLFRDNQGNAYKWKTSKAASEIQIDDKVKLKGTVKTHEEYKGIKQTELARCKIID